MSKRKLTSPSRLIRRNTQSRWHGSAKVARCSHRTVQGRLNIEKREDVPLHWSALGGSGALCRVRVPRRHTLCVAKPCHRLVSLNLNRPFQHPFRLLQPLGSAIGRFPTQQIPSNPKSRRMQLTVACPHCRYVPRFASGQ